MSEIKKMTTGLPGWAKGVIVVAGAAVLVTTGVIIYIKVSRAAQKAKAKNAQKDLKNDLKTAISSQPASYSDGQYQEFANSLWQAMDGWGTDNDKIMSVMDKMKNDTDILKLIDIYGIRKISSGKGNPAPDLNDGLTAAFGDELSSSEINKINKKFEDKKIKFRF